MSLEHKLKEKTIIIRRATPDKALKEIKEGKKFIIVDDSFTQSMIPLGYMLIDTQYKQDSFKALVPQKLLFYLANPGESGVDDALDEISDFYSEIEDFEDDKLEENGDSVQGTNWAITARNSYSTYIINKLTIASKDNPDIPEWNKETLISLNVDDPYVNKRLKAIAALCLGKTSENDLKKYDLGDILKHVTINERKEENLKKEEFEEVTCWVGSHYDIKEEYRHNPNVEYMIESRHDENHKVGKKITHKRDEIVLDEKISDLEDEIEAYRKENNPASITSHDKMLLRAYTNITYIAKEDSSKQLEIKPEKGGDAHG